jgi:PAS domain S-box-containing protein
LWEIAQKPCSLQGKRKAFAVHAMGEQHMGSFVSQSRFDTMVGPGRRTPAFAADPILALDDAGVICGCNPAAEALFNYRASELVGQHVSTVLPQLKQWQLVRDGRPDPRLRFLCNLGHHFEVTASNGQRFPSELFLNCIDDSGPARLRLTVRPLQSVAA